MNGKELKQNYNLNPPAMGIYRIQNQINNKVFIGSTLNLSGIMNRQKFQLNMVGNTNKTLLADWNELGRDNFSFEVLEVLVPRENPDYNYREDLECLEDLWLEKLDPYGEKGYNEKKKSTDERLRMIAQRRLKRETIKG